MEQEYKWKLAAPADAQALLNIQTIRSQIVGHETVEMAATYYDTPGRLLWQLHGGLRLRRENQVSVCCLKLSVTEISGCALREEYEAQANTIEEGLSLLPNKGAPAELCSRLQAEGLTELCAVTYTRQAYQLRVIRDRMTCTGELTVDLGSASRQGRSGPISEMEFEMKSGDEASFHVFAQELAAEFHLEPEPLSKLARAMSV